MLRLARCNDRLLILILIDRDNLLLLDLNQILPQGLLLLLDLRFHVVDIAVKLFIIIWEVNRVVGQLSVTQLARYLHVGIVAFFGGVHFAARNDKL